MKHHYKHVVRHMLFAFMMVLCITLLLAVLWSMTTAIVFFIGSAFWLLCWMLSYYCRATFSFNNIADTSMNSMVALLTNSIPEQKATTQRKEADHFAPFVFRQDKEQAQEDLCVRALLYQVFSSEEGS